MSAHQKGWSIGKALTRFYHRTSITLHHICHLIMKAKTGIPPEITEKNIGLAECILAVILHFAAMGIS